MAEFTPGTQEVLRPERPEPVMLSARHNVPRLIGRSRSTLAYSALVVFSFLYYTRPEDFIPGLAIVPINKIAGGIALAALIFGIPARQRHRLTTELKVLLVLLVQLLLCIPFAYWRGGAYDAVVNKFSKGVIVALLIYGVTTTVKELRRLLFIQAASVALVAVASVIVHHTLQGRLMGLQKGILENPNDLAINLAINFPLCMAFMLAARGGGKKLLWAAGLAIMSWAVVATYSRSGLLAMVVTVVICIWEFGIKGRRPYILMGTVLVAFVALGAVVLTPHYIARMQSIFGGNVEGSLDRGSFEARQHLLVESLELTAKHPVFGIGPGNFAAYTGEWRVAHNTYTELSAEAGVPALLLFVALLLLTLRKLKKVRELPGYAGHEDIRLWTSALWAALAAYLAGAVFASTEYSLFPYFMVGYVSALYQIASHPAAEAPAPSRLSGSKWTRRWLTIGEQA